MTPTTRLVGFGFRSHILLSMDDIERSLVKHPKHNPCGLAHNFLRLLSALHFLVTN